MLGVYRFPSTILYWGMKSCLLNEIKRTISRIQKITDHISFPLFTMCRCLSEWYGNGFCIITFRIMFVKGFDVSRRVLYLKE